MNEKQRRQYFDWAATGIADGDILREALEETAEKCGNPSSLHAAGKEAAALLEDARGRCAAVLGVPARCLYFTSGGTESDQIPLLSVLNRPGRGTVLISAVEHPAVREQAAALRKCGWNVATVPADRDGIITPDAVTGKLTADTALVCVMAVNNETGAIQPVAEIARAVSEACAGRRRPKFHTDCVQAAGKIPLDLAVPGIDSAALSAHKLCGPRGIGLLYLAEPVEPFLRGGGQERSVRSGTENVFGAVAFAKCLERYFVSDKNPAAERRLSEQREYTRGFVRALSRIEGCAVIPESRTDDDSRYSPWIVQAAFRNIPGQVMLRALDAEGWCVSTGSACSSNKRGRPVLDAMRVPREVSAGAVRFSFGPSTTEAAMRELCGKLSEIARRFR